ncbi:MAG: hypothetical protein K9W46_01945 [Candidatus Heimdallarchaeum endolithica]|uniref:Uncharacterized protein n=1 Tax=Candidatus Heimdallarchaeum endolithica TaxID=2876572 RepID=A0A9Y1BRN6_9ARCH|nr:MAG: hypothetical protein K9W46_01945 [Candidatus Heimdallarchaeum endolithica]
MNKRLYTYLTITGVIFLVLMSSLPLTSLADKGDNVNVGKDNGSFIIDTPLLKVKLLNNKPDIMFWIANDTDSNKRKPVPAYHIGFKYVVELFGDDLVVDNRTELGGKSYNLATIDWTLTTENKTDEVISTLSSEILSNGATISFIFHVFTKDTTVTRVLNDNTTVTYEVKALSEIKFDIVVSNWTFTEGAVGLTFVTTVHELAYRHRVRAGNATHTQGETEERNSTKTTPREKRDNDPEKWGVEFTDDKGNLQSYFAWTPEADVFDADDNYLKTVNVTATTAERGFKEKKVSNKKFGIDYLFLFITYPNYGDNLKLVHDPTIGVVETSSGLPWATTASIVLPLVIVGLIVINRRRK